MKNEGKISIERVKGFDSKAQVCRSSQNKQAGSEMKQKQIENAVKYCIENRCKGYKAISKMKNAQNLLYVPNKEEDLVNNWFDVDFGNKKNCLIAKILN